MNDKRSITDSFFDDLNDIINNPNVEEHQPELIPYKNGYMIDGDYEFDGKLDKKIIMVTGDVRVDFYVESLKGCPEEIHGEFNCEGCDKLTSLEGGPKFVGEAYNCGWCKNLKSLKGGPVYAREFNCQHCDNLESLEGAPEEVDKFDCSNCKKLTSFKGCPKIVNESFDCCDCENIVSLEYAPTNSGCSILSDNCTAFEKYNDVLDV